MGILSSQNTSQALALGKTNDNSINSLKPNPAKVHHLNVKLGNKRTSNVAE